ncbi:Uncharacterised protein [Serratia plymuthica]|nr:Uncharacterised protein [Serratia plymuthica]
MNKKTDKSVWEANNIPALEYCKLPRAAELLNCKIEDIIHFSEIGAIELSIKLRGFEVCLNSPFEWREQDVWEERFRPSLFPYSHNSPLSLLRPKADILLSKEKGKYYYQNEDNTALRSPRLYLYGLWSLVIMPTKTPFFSHLSQGHEVSLTALELSLKECDIPFTERMDDNIIFVSPPSEHLYQNDFLDATLNNPIVSLTINDIYLTRKQIEKIHNGMGEVLPSYINNGVIIPNKNEENEPPSTSRLTVHQFSFIYALLKILDFSEQQIRTNSPDEINELLNKKAAKKGVSYSSPDKNTWVRWRDKFPEK